jgi:chromosome segregation protein
MRLTRLDIFGFKSFASKVNIPFSKGTTAIVGPNGCGKSNVVEAIRWVLGEQRAGAFRSSRMEDVIFAGTRNRKQLGMSDVSLTIENTNNVLPIDYSEVTITRRLFRSGESDYLLNKVPCRLLDIQNLLMDTGLGPGAYSVMEQGMVDEIISDKTENRRRILEEAAGITKYKARRKSTWNRLEATQQDLTRLEDRITEIKRQVDYLSRQAGKAKRYQELSRELKELDLLLGRYHFFTIQEELNPLEHNLKEIDGTQESGLTLFTTREAEIEKSRLAAVDAEKAHTEVSQALNSCIDEIHAKDRQRIAVSEQLKASEQFITRSRSELEQDTGRLTENREQRSEALQNLTQDKSLLEEAATHLDSREELTAETEQQYSSSQAALSQARRQNLDLIRQQGEHSRAIERINTEREGIQSRDQQLAEEISQLDHEYSQAEQRFNEAEGALDDSNAALDTLGQIERELGLRQTATLEYSQDLARRHEESRRAIQANDARLQVLKQVRAGYQGYSDGVRTLILESPHKDLFQGVLGDQIDVDPRYHHAVETALGEALEALLTEGDDDLDAVLDYLRQNKKRAGIFPLAWHRVASSASEAVSLDPFPGLLGPLVSFVRADPSVAPLVDRLLGNTFLVEDLGQAMHLAATYLDRRVRFVTPTGDAIDLYGRVAGGEAAGDDAGVLGRRREIRTLKGVIAHGKATRTGCLVAAAATERRRQILQIRRTSNAARLEQQREQQREASHRKQNAHAELERTRSRLQRLSGDRGQFAQRLEQLHKDLQNSQQQMVTCEDQSLQTEKDVAENEERLRQIEVQRREQQDQLAALRVEQARAAEKVSSLERDTQRLAHLERSLEQNINRLTAETEEAVGRREKLSIQEREIGTALVDMHGRRETLDEQRNERYTHWQEVTALTRKQEEEISRLQRQLADQRDRRHQFELRRNELRQDSKQTQERLMEEYQVDIAAMGPLEDADFVPEPTQGRIAQIRRSIQNLGPVHVGVLDEYEEAKERYDFYVHHRDDLMQAAEDLKKTLNRIDSTARRIFSTTFDEIRSKFKETFVRFFPGGEADLVPEPNADPLEANIDISARPRGKRLQSIKLLSGGERALTAIALLFAIYQVKPSPFCILDEVDAPLDDTNVERFIRVLKEFAQKTQFIMVTHNKISMSAGDSLHGVTMPEEGVSQLVSVAMDEDFQIDEAAG